MTAVWAIVSIGAGLVAVLAVLVALRRSRRAGADLWLPAAVIAAVVCVAAGIAASRS